MSIQPLFDSGFACEVEQSDAVLSSALRELSCDYPVLCGGVGSSRLVFRRGADPSVASVRMVSGGFEITYGSVAMALRMVGNIISGIVPGTEEYCPFRMFGIMLDCSRNAVMTLPNLKRYMRRLAILGYNMLMLYTEDTYRIEGEPFFGLMRGAYSPEEIKEIDDYAASLGIEVIPCIQTLAHLEQMFRWNCYKDINDLNGILLVDEPKTYELIEKMIVTWKNCVRSRRIHLGMDEAHGIGDGKFKKLHGEESRFNIINRHLGKVMEICRRHGLEPMMWSDMYFRCGSKTDDYYDKECVIPEEVVRQIPKDVELVYWDYYNTDKEFYKEWIARHRALGGEPVMGSGVWTWRLFWYDHTLTRKTVIPCIQACREAKVKDVFFTMWGDDGAYCDYDSAMAGLAFASDLAHTGAANDAVLEAKFRHLLHGASYKDTLAIAKSSYFYLPGIIWDDPIMQMFTGAFYFDSEKRGIYDDIKFDFATAVKSMQESLDSLPRNPKSTEGGSIPYGRKLLEFAIAKCNFVKTYLDAYRRKDNRKAVAGVIPMAERLLRVFRQFSAEHHKVWFSHNKPFGYETVQVRLGGEEARIKELVRRLKEFAEGRAQTMPETDDLIRIGESLKESCGFWALYPTVSHGTIII